MPKFAGLSKCIVGKNSNKKKPERSQANVG